MKWTNAEKDRLPGPPGDRGYAGNEGQSAALGEGEEGLERQRHLIEKLRI